MATLAAPPPPPLRNLGTILRETREAKGHSKTVAARELGISRMAYDQWERDVWMPGYPSAAAVAAYTGLRVEDVVGMFDRALGRNP